MVVGSEGSHVSAFGLISWPFRANRPGGILLIHSASKDGLAAHLLMNSAFARTKSQRSDINSSYVILVVDHDVDS